MTPLRKRVVRRSEAVIRSGGKPRRIVVTLYPHGLIGLRLERTRREEVVPLETAYTSAVLLRVAIERAERKAKRKRART